MIRAATIAIAIALSAPAMAGTKPAELTAVDMAVLLTYDRECTGLDYPKLIGAASCGGGGTGITIAAGVKAEESARAKMVAQWSLLPRAMTWGCVDGAPASISADFSNFWRQAVDCTHDFDAAAVTKMWIEHTQQGQYE